MIIYAILEFITTHPFWSAFLLMMFCAAGSGY
jgi:hypothetical protein